MKIVGIFRLALAIILFCALTRSVHCLQCYECSSIQDERCGEDWEFEGSEADKYIVECHANATACRKYVNEESGFGERVYRGVYRSCWTHTTNVTYTPTGCEEYMGITDVCFCSNPNGPCNRDNSLVVSLWVTAGGIFSCFVVFMIR